MHNTPAVTLAGIFTITRGGASPSCCSAAIGKSCQPSRSSRPNGMLVQKRPSCADIAAPGVTRFNRLPACDGSPSTRNPRGRRSLVTLHHGAVAAQTGAFILLTAGTPGENTSRSVHQQTAKRDDRRPDAMKSPGRHVDTFPVDPGLCRQENSDVQANAVEIHFRRDTNAFRLRHLFRPPTNAIFAPL